jgi:hypothetical protein
MSFKPVVKTRTEAGMDRMVRMWISAVARWRLLGWTN